MSVGGLYDDGVKKFEVGWSTVADAEAVEFECGVDGSIGTTGGGL